MRRTDRKLADEYIDYVLNNSLFGTLALCDGEFPYSLPISFTNVNRTIYLHGANEGMKIDLLKKNSKVSFSAVCDVENLPSKFSTKYKSIIAKCNGCIVEDEEEKLSALYSFIEKYAEEFLDSGLKYAKNDVNKTTIIRLDIIEITVKGRLND
jgi:nitroimidazol reductase NimA-like FMN-containing flavoprotein (pyridoxamine 5'-phosphate oxidase superfamily)